MADAEIVLIGCSKYAVRSTGAVLRRCLLSFFTLLGELRRRAEVVALVLDGSECADTKTARFTVTQQVPPHACCMPSSLRWVVARVAPVTMHNMEGRSWAYIKKRQPLRNISCPMPGLVAPWCLLPTCS